MLESFKYLAELIIFNLVDGIWGFINEMVMIIILELNAANKLNFKLEIDE